jgi:hypothetical protein
MARHRQPVVVLEHCSAICHVEKLNWNPSFGKIAGFEIPDLPTAIDALLF